MPASMCLAIINLTVSMIMQSIVLACTQRFVIYLLIIMEMSVYHYHVSLVMFILLQVVIVTVNRACRVPCVIVGNKTDLRMER